MRLAEYTNKKKAKLQIFLPSSKKLNLLQFRNEYIQCKDYVVKVHICMRKYVCIILFLIQLSHIYFACRCINKSTTILRKVLENF